MQSKFISHSERQAQPSKGRREIKTKNNGISDDTEQWQEYQKVQTAMEHILNNYYNICPLIFSWVQRRENGVINSGEASWVGFELKLQKQTEFS